jgi:hypothetical protein
MSLHGLAPRFDHREGLMKLVRAILAACALTVIVVPFAAAQQGQRAEETQPMMGGRQMPLMGGLMVPMMGMMGESGMMPMMGGMMTPMIGMADHVEGRLAFLKTELKITDAQRPQWDAFADAMRANATQMSDMRKQAAAMMQAGTPPSLPQRLEFTEQHAANYLQMLQRLKGTLLPLYASFSDDQKRAADALFRGPMGM